MISDRLTARLAEAVIGRIMRCRAGAAAGDRCARLHLESGHAQSGAARIPLAGGLRPEADAPARIHNLWWRAATRWLEASLSAQGVLQEINSGAARALKWVASCCQPGNRRRA